jgi:hypothetical protein
MAVAVGEGRAPIRQKVIPANAHPKLKVVESTPQKAVFLLRHARYFDASTGRQ